MTTEAQGAGSGLSGRTIGGYRLIEKVGEGGMGAVYRAHEESLDRVVAIKILAPALAGDATYRTRFIREAKALARLRHSNLVPIFSVSEAEGLHFYAMDFVEGESLRRRVARLGPRPGAEIVKVAEQVLGALATVHAAGITHRDVKSANIMIEPSGRALLMDLGLAKDDASESMTSAGVIMGTPEYMPPEQAEGLPATQISDIYSFGVVLYEMAAGAVPFRGKSAIAILRKQVEEKPPSLAAVRPDLPPDLIAAIESALDKDSARRPQSAAEFARMLAEAGQGVDLDATALTQRVSSIAPRLRPHLGAGAVAVTATALAVVIAVAAALFLRPVPQTRIEPAPEPAAQRATPLEVNVIAEDGSPLMLDVRLIEAGADGIVVESAGVIRTIPYASRPILEYVREE